MYNKIKYLRIFVRLVAAIIALSIIAGCASTPGGGVDRMGLSNAIAIDDVRSVRAAVESQAITVNDVVPGVGYTATPLITVAARYGSLNVLRYLIAARADLNARTPDGDTALMLAAFFGEEEQRQNASAYGRYDNAVRALVEAGASLDSAGPGAYSPLSYAAYAGRDNAVRYLLEKGAKVDANAQGRLAYINTPLMMAAMQGHRNAALHLLRAGANANVRVQNGMTALEFAQKHKHAQLESALRCAEALKADETFRQRCE